MSRLILISPSLVSPDIKSVFQSTIVDLRSTKYLRMGNYVIGIPKFHPSHIWIYFPHFIIPNNSLLYQKLVLSTYGGMSTIASSTLGGTCVDLFFPPNSCFIAFWLYQKSLFCLYCLSRAPQRLNFSYFAKILCFSFSVTTLKPFP